LPARRLFIGSWKPCQKPNCRPPACSNPRQTAMNADSANTAISTRTAARQRSVR